MYRDDNISETHQVSSNELAGVPLPKRPAVREVSDGRPQSHVVRVGVLPARECVVNVLNERGIVVVVDGIAVDVPQYMPHTCRHGNLVEVAAFERATLHPEVLGAVESRMVQLLEAVVAGD